MEVIAIFDIGKSNQKFLLFDSWLNMVHSERKYHPFTWVLRPYTVTIKTITKLYVMRKSILLFPACLLLSLVAPAQLIVTNLLTENLSNPMGHWCCPSTVHLAACL